MSENASSKLYARITRLRWQAPALAFLLVLAHQLLEHTLLVRLPRWWHFATQLLFYGLVGPLLAWWALTSLRRSVRETARAERALRQAHAALSEANARLAFLIRVNRRLAEAEDEEALSTIILELPQEVVPAVGCSLIRFDERQQPLPVIYQGNLDRAALDAWTARLSDPQVRQRCACCSVLEATTEMSCSLLLPIAEASPVAKVHCLRLGRNERQYGILHIFLQDARRPTGQEASLLQAMAQEMSLALESQFLRSREMDILLRLQQAHRLSNLQSELTGVLAHSIEALGADGGVLFVDQANSQDLQVLSQGGRSLGSNLELVQGLAAGVQQANTPTIIGDLENGLNAGLRSLLIAPLHTQEQVLGSLVLWSGKPGAFARRQARLVGIVAGQAALLLENHRLYLQGEHQATLAERARLAREIHDGLAQTLGYLKLRIHQIAGWLQAGDGERAAAGLDGVRQLLAEAYVDAREAIDGLHLRAGNRGVADWSAEIVSEFEALCGIPVEIACPSDVAIPLEVHAQLQRIVQEALSNVRKHAHATKGWLTWQVEEYWLTLRIRDNGRGFDPDSVPPMARHGLRSMKERAELLDADFQITSQPNTGTQILVRLPRQKLIEELQDG